MKSLQLIAQIPRNLGDTPDYPSDWRWQTAEVYLGAILASADAEATLATCAP